MPTIHSPGGLLANHGSSAPSIPLGGSSASGSAFGGPLHNDSGRAPPHGGPPPVGSGPQHQIFANISQGPNGPNGALGGSNGAASLFGGPLQLEAHRGGPPEGGRGLQHMPFPAGVSGAPPMPTPGMPAAGAAGMPQGQQPILNVSI
jgi:paired amphipathic helix protein Sin3a